MFLTDFQVMLKSLVQRPHFESDWFISKDHIAGQIVIIKTWHYSGQVISTC